MSNNKSKQLLIQGSMQNNCVSIASTDESCGLTTAKSGGKFDLRRTPDDTLDVSRSNSTFFWWS
jgi:hypothetical protein